MSALRPTPVRPRVRALDAGLAAGPLFLVVWAAQAFTRSGFEPDRHPLSLLALGALGWIQIANFVVTGTLLIAAGAGLWRTLGPGRSVGWGSALIAGFGVGMIVAGVFVTDPGAGFPAGAPAGAPERFTWHGALHEIGFVVASLCWTAAAVLFLVRFLRRRRWVASAATAVTFSAVLTLAAWPDLDGLSVRLVVATALQFAFVAALTVDARQFARYPSA
ncbi:DUF998 domain-containing protein [Cryptosporangium minutisporangium]|uniref:DUF998 domain-containing protein n=1 Tax=Cryptosporangium minutisporangium TaxID=113569 RepID=A0ABP6SZM0_9ACTN